jgi:plasmid maintenance system antidote protein VapI
MCLSVTKNWRLTEKAFGVSMGTLMRTQNSYDIAQARRCARFVRKVGLW